MVPQTEDRPSRENRVIVPLTARPETIPSVSATVAQRLRASRLLAEVSQKDAAAQLGVSVPTLERAEKEERPVPKPWIEWSRQHWRPPEGIEHPFESPSFEDE
jgi:hypothetical protein